MAVVEIEGKKITLPDDVVRAGDKAIRSVLAANGFPAIENAEIKIEGSKSGGAPSVIVSPRSTTKGGTKENPGKYDCHAKAAPDEPIFTLRAKDVSAPYLVRIWAFVRQGKFEEARIVLDQLIADRDVQKLIGDCEKFDEAFIDASDMRAWRAKQVKA